MFICFVQVHSLPEQTRILERLQEHSRCDSCRTLLRHVHKCRVDDELHQCQVERITRLPQGHPTDQGLQAHQAFRRTPGEHANIMLASGEHWCMMLTLGSHGCIMLTTGNHGCIILTPVCFLVKICV